MKNLLLKLFAIILLAGFFHACNETLVDEQPVNDLELKSAQNIKQSYIVVLEDAELNAELSGLKGYENRKAAAAKAALIVLKRAGIADGQIGHVYGTAVKGFSVTISPGQLKKLENDPSVKYVEEDQVITLIEPKAKPGDGDVQASSTQETPWGITRVKGGAIYGDDVDVETKVAWIIDTGIDLDHPDLNVDGSKGATFVRGDSPDDDNGHGSHVAGTIAAIDNTEGVIGVAAGATVIPVKVLDRRGSGTTSGVIAGIDYVGANAATGDVANMSLGGGVSETLDAAVYDASQKGIYFSLAAGNESDDANNHSPARVNGDYIYTISAMDKYDNFASFSNYGNPPVDYCEPGVSVYSTYKDGGYTTYSGTSMAAPHMAGILLWGAPDTDGTVNDDPDGNPDPIGVVGSGGGDGSNTAPVASAGGPYEGDEDIAITFDASGSTDDDGDPLTYTWDFGDGNTVTTSESTVSHTYLWGDTFSVTLTVSDGNGGFDSETTSAAVTEVNDQPVANPGGPYSGSTGQEITFDASESSDFDNEDGTTVNDQDLSYTWDFGDGNVSTTNSTTITHTYETAADYTVKLVVNDGIIDSDTASTTATISDEAQNQAPSLVIELRDTSNPAWARVAVDWTASDDGNLESITSELYDDSDFSNLIDSETTSLSGTSASGTHELGIKGGHEKTYYVKVTVSDGVNETIKTDSKFIK